LTSLDRGEKGTKKAPEMTKILLAGMTLLLAVLAGQAAAKECFCDLCSRPPVSDAEADITCLARLATLESKETAKFRQLVECSVRQWQCGDGALFFDL
jgi:hypothetical protein